MAVSANKKSVMTLYSLSNDAYCHRVRIVLSEKGVAYDFINVDVNSKMIKNLLEVNPYGTLPTLVDRDLILYDSEIIMEYLDERFPHPPLMPIYPVTKGRSRLMIHRINVDWYSKMNIILDTDKTNIEKDIARKTLRESLLSAIPLFAEMPCFLSKEFSLVDYCIAPLLWRLPRLGIQLPNQARSIFDYAERIFAREAFQASLTDSERMIRYTTRGLT